MADDAEAPYYRDQFDIRTNTMKQLWQNLNAIFSNKRGKTQTIISCLKLGDKHVTNTNDVCNGLNSFYCTVGHKLVESLPTVGQKDFTGYCPLPCSISMFCNPVDTYEVYK